MHWKAGRWFGKQDADAYEVDGDGHGGMVAQSGRWFSESWCWDHHWLTRTRCGQWRAKGGSAEVCHRGKGHDGEHAYSAPSVERAKAAAVPDDVLYGGAGATRKARKQSDRQRVAGDYKAYLEARLDDAERATSGNAPRRFFDGRKRSLRGAPEELRDWMEANGPNLTATAFRRQASGGGSYWPRAA